MCFKHPQKCLKKYLRKNYPHSAKIATSATPGEINISFPHYQPATMANGHYVMIITDRTKEMKNVSLNTALPGADDFQEYITSIACSPVYIISKFYTCVYVLVLH